jgi:CDP-diacylglycerol--glycerol-3-phosphate 3-phosphatidyltransferase
MNSGKLNAANLLTGFRLVAAPILLGFGWFDWPIAFLALLAVSFLSDVLDGYVARRLEQTSSFGARLDTWSDGVIYSTIAVSSWWLWPDIVSEQAPYAWGVVASFTLPTLVGVSKFKTFTSYHTMSVKVAAAMMGSSIYPLFLLRIDWPFHFATFVCILAAVEETAITILMTEPHSNIKSLMQVIQKDTQDRIE